MSSRTSSPNTHQQNQRNTMSSRTSSPTPSTSSSDTGEIDIAHLDNVYQALMSTILDVPTHSIPPQVVVDGTTNNASVEEGEGKADGSDGEGKGGVKNAKRRKMDKKRAKREEQKLAQEESVDAVEFKLFSRKPVTLVSLLPAEEPIWTTRNPRHVPLTDAQTQELRRKVRSVVVDGADVMSVEQGRAVVEREVVTAQLPESTILHLTIPRELPPFSATFLTTHPSYAPPQPPKAAKGSAGQGKKSTTSSAGKTSDPVVEALKRTRIQKQQRGNVHVLFTTNGKIRPPGKQDSVPTSVPLVLAREGETKVDKAHLRRLARRAHRMGHLPSPSDYLHAHLPTANGTSSGKAKSTAGPWVNPLIPPARFWSAPEELGGSSGGYAYGFAGSLPGTSEREEGRRRGGVYVRDRMR